VKAARMQPGMLLPNVQGGNLHIKSIVSSHLV
jgi:hypothetical protein